ncbi:Co2+/Mg2+ efflux protein ApaG [Entomobacter blattae]|uniref:Protein ApaG n=1 Tax=Entomobacter blattae TaxID=2762277 RepID=A0A7H1NQK6_9PROT|nr:Co2+/Mg2+ efflux protein ApaG [Entomobacter blattae]QNT78066.1 Protein ApaG [Entomobacter blattae]
MAEDFFHRAQVFFDPEGLPLDLGKNLGRFEAVTEKIHVSVKAFWLEDQSTPEEGLFCWAYHIRVENHGSDTVKLLSRQWEIIDGGGRIEHVQGHGVVGEQPVLNAGVAFEYTSSVMLRSPSGFMRGKYTLINHATNERFDIQIPTFSLDSPYQFQLVQ